MASPGLWAPSAERLALWGMKTPAEAKDLPFTPTVLIVDGL
jgi:glycerophosphoryl diester phosphodiesterase